ncbi:MAG: pantoate--beta-alanine ligase [Phycisphaerae bacterium]|jgi:pantoate--beta-alanine ligase
MQVTRDIPRTRAAVRAARDAGRRIGFAPTMGALHAGHVSLIEAARRDDTYPVVSIFVNPTQFGPGEDYQNYPRDTAADLECCAAAGAAQVFIPAVEDMYRPDAVTTVHVVRLTDTLCGPFRPGHFTGVATVCIKLFNIIQPNVAYFGQKDYQQLAVLRRMVADLDLPLEIVGCPIVREESGLALSSRNRYLSPAERQQATCLYRGLCDVRERIHAGERDTVALLAVLRETIERAGPARIDYLSIVDPESLQPVAEVGAPVLIALAVRIGPARLIDNMLVDPAAPTA